MIKFSKDKVLLIHQLIAEETGGSIGVRTKGCWSLPWRLHFPVLEEMIYTQPKKKKAHALDTI